MSAAFAPLADSAPRPAGEADPPATAGEPGLVTHLCHRDLRRRDLRRRDLRRRDLRRRDLRRRAPLATLPPGCFAARLPSFPARRRIVKCPLRTIWPHLR